jgi:osmoprotectant transport system ATP-binding protein
VFVTHDIDEAIKVGDRIAVLRQGGVLAQYATPSQLLAAPADDFVADFVGADRALKRLALIRVGEIPLAAASGSSARRVEIPRDATLRDALSQILAAGERTATVVDPDGAPLGELSLDAISAHHLRAEVEAEHAGSGSLTKAAH